MRSANRFLICFTAMICAANAFSYPLQLWPSYTQPNRVSMRHIERGGIGYKQGYTTLEGFFAPDPESVAVMPFLDLRGHVFNDGKLAANVGMGIRKLMNERVYGFNGYYDYRNTKIMHYNQLGIGAESLGRCWDFRVNGYFPLGKKITAPYQTEFVGFVGHEALISQKYQFGMTGFNAEFGLHFGSRVNYYAAAGPYYFAGKVGRKIWGGKIRFAIRFNEYIKVEFSNSYDRMFHDRFQGELTVNIPFGAGSCATHQEDYHQCALDDLLYSRMVQPVPRQEIIVVGYTQVTAPAINLATGQPFNFVFVDNTSSSLGTYESPYPTLALAQANSDVNDIIYVFPGDGTTTGMNAGITLKANQNFWGSGISHALQAAQGEFTIPAQSSSAPMVTNTNGDGITLDSANQVSGFTITDVTTTMAGGNGIFGTNLENIEISDCTINNSLADQIHLEYSGSSGTALLNNLTLTNGQGDGIFIDSVASNMICTVDSCAIQGNAVYSIEASFANDATVNATNNSMNGNVDGSIFNFSGNSTLGFSGNTVTNTSSVSSAPLTVTAQASPLSATITNNNIQNNECGSMNFQLNDTSLAQFTVSDNTMSNNASGSEASFGSAIVMNLNDTTLSNCYLNLTDNTFLNNAASALYCAGGSFNEFNINATGNTITDNGGGGLIFTNPSTTFTLTATNNTISNGGDNGIAITGGIIVETANMTITGNQITGNTNFANGILLGHEGTNLNFSVMDNNMSNNDTSGIIIYSSNLIENMTVNIANNTMSNNQNLGSNAAGGIDMEQFTNFAGTISNNTLLANVSGGLFINSTDPSSSACLTMTGNTSDTGYTLSNQGTTFNLAPCNVAEVNTGTITTSGAITAVQSCPDAIPCPI